MSRSSLLSTLSFTSVSGWLNIAMLSQCAACTALSTFVNMRTLTPSLSLLISSVLSQGCWENNQERHEVK